MLQSCGFTSPLSQAIVFTSWGKRAGLSLQDPGQLLISVAACFRSLAPDFAQLANPQHARTCTHMHACTHVRTRARARTHTHTEYPDIANTSAWDKAKNEVDYQHITEQQAAVVGLKKEISCLPTCLCLQI